MAILLALPLSGCAGLKSRFDALRGTPVTEEKSEEEQRKLLRKAAVREHKYQALRDELIVGRPLLSSETVRPGTVLTQETKITVLSPEAEKVFKVLEVVTLSGVNIMLELSRKEIDRHQGTGTSVVQITLPKDLPQGIYTLITIVSTGEQTFRQTASFRIEK